MKDNYRPAVMFLVVYVGVYLVLNTLYALYIQYYAPNPDPMTIVVTEQVALVLQAFGEPVVFLVEEGSPHVPILRDGTGIVRVYEGCNGLNVMIVYLAFLAAFRGPWKSTVLFVIFGLITIYVMNLVRVAALYGVALYYPDKLYFFHKFFFTGLIYLVVFFLWFLWIRKVKQWRSAQTS